MKQPVDQKVITTELLEWARLMGAPTHISVVFISTESNMTRDIFVASSPAGIGQAVDRALSTEGVKNAYGTIINGNWPSQAKEVPKIAGGLGHTAPMLPKEIGQPVGAKERQVTNAPNWVIGPGATGLWPTLSIFFTAFCFALAFALEESFILAALCLVFSLHLVLVWFASTHWIAQTRNLAAYPHSQYAHCFAYIPLGALAAGDEQTSEQWMPVLRAFEAGAFVLWLSDNIIFVATVPSVAKTDADRRLHCETGPAFIWLDGVAEYFWHGTVVPKAWILDSSSITMDEVFSETNTELRRAAIDILGGWSKILPQLGGKVIDKDRPHIGTLLEINLPNLEQPARFNKVLCGTGREFAYGVPPHIKTAREAQAFRTRIPVEMWNEPEIRT